MASILPSARAKKGDVYLDEARNLRDRWGQLIPSGDLTTIQNRITMSALFVLSLRGTRLFTFCMLRTTEMRQGLDGKMGLSKMTQARAYM